MFEAIAVGPFLLWTRLGFLLLGIALSVEFFLRLAQSAHLSLHHFRIHALSYTCAFIAGGRIAALIADYRVYVRDPLRFFVVWDGGFSYLGGCLAIAVVLFVATRLQRTTFLQWLDVLFPATCFGLVFDWIGKFASGQSYGSPTDGFWGVTYEAINVRYAVPIHPVQLYYALFFFVLTFLLLVIRKRASRAGAETLFGILCACGGTLLLEGFRGDFSIPVFATYFDFLILTALFLSLAIFAARDMQLSQKSLVITEAVLIGCVVLYITFRTRLGLPTFELRFSQFLSILAVLATIVYVVVHRRKYPHL